MRRPPMRRTWREPLLVVWAVLVLALGIRLVRARAPVDVPAVERSDVGAPARDVPMVRLRRRIEMGQLSDRRALYAVPVPEAAPAGAAPGRGRVPRSLRERLDLEEEGGEAR